MAPRQLLLELEEVDMAAEKGSKRVRVDRADESSMQLSLPEHWPELWLLAWVVSAAKTPSGVAAPPNTTTAQAVHYKTPRGFPNSSRISDSFVKFKLLSQTADRTHYTSTTVQLTIITFLCATQMVMSDNGPSNSSAAGSAAEAPAANVESASGQQARPLPTAMPSHKALSLLSSPYHQLELEPR
eukprot:scaffold27403_cov110-Isochrysis_galbana.AAC.3